MKTNEQLEKLARAIAQVLLHTDPLFLGVMTPPRIDPLYGDEYGLSRRTGLDTIATFGELNRQDVLMLARCVASAAGPDHWLYALIDPDRAETRAGKTTILWGLAGARGRPPDGEE